MFKNKKSVFQLVKKVSLALPFLFSTYAWADAASNQTYVVLYNQHSVPANAANIIAENGGTLIHSYDQIGVVIAQSNRDSFASSVSDNNKVRGVSASASFGTALSLETDEITALARHPRYISPWDIHVQRFIPLGRLN